MVPHLATALTAPVLELERRFVVGGSYCVHTGRGKDENLKAPDARFEPLAFEAPRIPDRCGRAGCAPNRSYAYGVVAHLAELAAAIEVGQVCAEEAFA